jgi:hypothetical protein
MADKNCSIIRSEEGGVEFFTIVESGESGMSLRGLSRMCGVSHPAILKLTKALITKSAPKRLKRFADKQLTLVTKFSSSNRKTRNVTIYTAEFCFAVIKHYAMEGSEIAEATLDAIGEIGLTSYIQAKTKWLPYQYIGSTKARDELNRILDTPDAWEKMYEKEACMKAFAWMGARFYWDFCYFWLTPAEKIKIDQINPCVRGCRKAKIHQCIEPETKARLTPHVQRLCDLLISSTSKQDFLTRYNRVFGINQQEFAV